MQTFVRSRALALGVGAVLSLLATMMDGGAWAQGTPEDAAKPAAEQAVPVPADKVADPEPGSAASDTKRTDGGQTPEAATPVPAAPIEDAKPAQADAKPAATEAPAAPSEAAVQAPPVAKDKPAEDNAAAGSPEIKPAAAGVTSGGATSDASKSESPAAAAAPRPAGQDKPGAKAKSGAADSSGRREHRSDDARRRARAGESSEGKFNHKVGCQNFRTYNAERGTYRGYDGRVHRCT